jgi:hypothetical protein
MSTTAIVIFATPSLEAIRSRWNAATIAATFYASEFTVAHQIASAAAMALPVAERRPAIVLRDGDVDEARALITQLAKLQGIQFTTERELAAEAKRRSHLKAVMTELRSKQNSGNLKPFNQACRERRDRQSGGRFLRHDAMLEAVAEKIVSGRKIENFDAALADEILNELEPAEAMRSKPGPESNSTARRR